MATPPAETGITSFLFAPFRWAAPVQKTPEQQTELDFKTTAVSRTSLDRSEAAPKTPRSARTHTRERSNSTSILEFTTSHQMDGPKLSPRRGSERPKPKPHLTDDSDQVEIVPSSSTGSAQKRSKATRTDDSTESSSSSKPVQRRPRRLSQAERANSIFFTALDGDRTQFAKAYATDGALPIISESFSSGGTSQSKELTSRASSSFLGKFIPSLGSKTDSRKAAKGIGAYPDLKNWLELDLPPGIFAFHYKQISDIMASLLSSQSTLRKSEIRKKEAEELYTSPWSGKSFADLKLLSKEIKWLLSLLTKRDYAPLLEEKRFLEGLLKEESLGAIITSINERKSKVFFEFSFTDEEKIENVKNQLNQKLEKINRMLMPFSSDEECERECQRLEIKLSLIKIMRGWDSIDEALDEMKEIVEEETNKIESLNSLIQPQRERIQKSYSNGNFHSKAIELLGTNAWKKEITSIKDFLEVQAIAIEMIRLMVPPVGYKQPSNNPEEIRGGSGEIYKVYHKESANTQTPKFIFKPLRGAPGMPKNPKDNGPLQLKVRGNRSLLPARLAFPVNEGLFREYAVGILGYEPMRFLTSLPLPGDQFSTLHPGLVMEYVDHLFSVSDLLSEVKRLHYRDRVQELEKKIDALKGEGGETSSTSQEELRNLESNLKFAKGELEPLETKEPRSSSQEELAEKCRSDERFFKLSQSRIWEVASKKSLYNLVRYSLQVPDMDRNGENILIAEKKVRVNDVSKKVYTFAIVDADQTFPDSWEGLASINKPAWLGSPACDFSLSKIKKSIVAFNASQMLEMFKKNGIYFQERQRTYIDFEGEGKELRLGGDLFAILHAFHTVAKVGLINGNTANQVGTILFDNMERAEGVTLLHSLFQTSKKDFKENSSKSHPNLQTDEYKAFIDNPLYRECLGEISLPEGQQKKQWKLFEALVLQTLITKFPKNVK